MIKINEVKKLNDKNSKFILELRNKTYVRKNSIDYSKITAKSHKLFIKKFFNRKNKLYIISKKNVPIGYIRLEFKNNFYNTSWALDKKYQKKGYAKKSLIYATKNKKYRYKAIIKKKNLISFNLAKIANFKLKKTINNFYYVYKN